VKKITQLFGTEKPIIALLHLQPLPGDPAYGPNGRMDQVVKAAKADLIALQEGGVDGILFSNEFSLPYQQKVDPVIVGAMGRIIGELKDIITLPYGVHVISDAMATIELAAAVDASFVRSVFTGAYVGEAGLRSTDIAAVLRRKAALGLDKLAMFYMINAESDGDLSGRELSLVAQAVIFKCKPDGLCVSGIHAGHGVESNLIAEIRAVSTGTAVLCNTGCHAQNIAEKLSFSDGAFVGTAFKQKGSFENPVDGVRVKEFMAVVDHFRTR